MKNVSAKVEDDLYEAVKRECDAQGIKLSHIIRRGFEDFLGYGREFLIRRPDHPYNQREKEQSNG